MKEWAIPLFCHEQVHNKFGIFNTYFYYCCYRDVVNLLKLVIQRIADIYGDRSQNVVKDIEIMFKQLYTKNDLDLKPLGCELRKYPSAIEWDVQLIPTKKEKLAVARD